MLIIMSYIKSRDGGLNVFLFANAQSKKDRTVILAEYTDEEYGLRFTKEDSKPRDGYTEFLRLRLAGRMGQFLG